MAQYEFKEIDGLTYSVPIDSKPRKKKPPFVVVMNENCTCCSGSPACMAECPVDCIHMVYDRNRPVRVYVDTEVCIGCMNCLSRSIRPGAMLKGNPGENAERLNKTDLFQKEGVCPWDAIELHEFEEGVERSKKYYPQPRAGAESEPHDKQPT